MMKRELDSVEYSILPKRIIIERRRKTEVKGMKGVLTNEPKKVVECKKPSEYDSMEDISHSLQKAQGHIAILLLVLILFCYLFGMRGYSSSPLP